MKRIRFLSLLCLFVILPISIATADMSVTWVRTGVVIETEHKEGISDKIRATTVFDGTADELAEVPTTQQLDTHRVLLQFTWQPNQDYQFRLNDQLKTATAPLKPVSYLIRTVELDALLPLMENLRQPAKPTAIALGHGKAPYTHKLAVATDRGHLAVLQTLSGKTLWKTRISEGYVRRMAFNRDNSLLYIGEQAADGFIYCYNFVASEPTLRWKYRTAMTSKPLHRAIRAVSTLGSATPVQRVCKRWLTETFWSQVCTHGQKTIHPVRCPNSIGLTAKPGRSFGNGPAIARFQR